MLTIFYFYTKISKQNSSDDYYIGNFNDRISTIEKINALLLKSGLNPEIYIKINRKKNTKAFSKNINFITNFIPFEENQRKIKESRIILDVHKKIQNGLTFRVFEAIGLNKKLITTNKDIVNYDFYNPNNIFVWDENITEIPINFLEKEYEKLSDEIYKKYSLENWVKTIFNIK